VEHTSGWGRSRAEKIVWCPTEVQEGIRQSARGLAVVTSISTHLNMENMGHADGVPMECEGKGRGKQMAAVEH
jgi:hypothetical protein